MSKIVSITGPVIKDVLKAHVRVCEIIKRQDKLGRTAKHMMKEMQELLEERILLEKFIKQNSKKE